MRVERSSVDQVKQRFETLKRKQAETFTEEGEARLLLRLFGRNFLCFVSATLETQ